MPAPTLPDADVTADDDRHAVEAARGTRARDWAYLSESAATPVYEAVFDDVCVNAHTHLLDVACGAGGALACAARRRARLAGIDASSELIDIARCRVPDADIRHASMFALPFADGSFDVVTSFNGIGPSTARAFGGIGQVLAPGGRLALSLRALVEMRRVLAPGGRLALSFWDLAQPSEHLDVLEAMLRRRGGDGDEDGAETTVRRADAAAPSFVERMVRNAGFIPRASATAPVTNEWPDRDIATRALLSSGPQWAALDSRVDGRSGELLRDAMSMALAPFDTEGVGVRLRSHYQYVIADV